MGARRRMIFGAVVLEAAVIGALGALIGFAIYFSLLAGVANLIRTQTGVVLPVWTWQPVLAICPVAMIALCAFGGVLWDREAVRQKLASLDAQRQAVRAFAWHCAWLVTQRRDCVREMSQLKALAGELANAVAYGCQQCFGGMGYIRETSIERLWRDARILSIGGGATEVMLEEAAKRL
jgi:alkylation response protein AidB-like acyl-CoA dehydrogenase